MVILYWNTNLVFYSIEMLSDFYRSVYVDVLVRGVHYLSRQRKDKYLESVYPFYVVAAVWADWRTIWAVFHVRSVSVSL